MFKVIIALEEVGSSENLAEACHIYISKIKEMIKNGQGAACVIYEACTIEAAIEGQKYMMNFNAIRDFAHEIGILNENGSLSENPVPIIPIERAYGVIIVANYGSLEAYREEHTKQFQSLLAPDSQPIVVGNLKSVLHTDN